MKTVRYISRVSYDATNSRGDLTCHCSINVASEVDSDEAAQAAVPASIQACRDYRFVSRRLIKTVMP